MQCPNCNKEIPTIVCHGCNSKIPEMSRYCLYCGLDLKDKCDYGDDFLDSGEVDDFDFKSRIPCSDGNCIGIIVNEKCNICGKRYKGKKK